MSQHTIIDTPERQSIIRQKSAALSISKFMNKRDSIAEIPTNPIEISNAVTISDRTRS